MTHGALPAKHTIPAFYFDMQELQRLLEIVGPNYSVAQPFPHVVIDDFFPDDIADALAAEFPDVDQCPWIVSGPGMCKPLTNDAGQLTNNNKLVQSVELWFGPLARHIMMMFNGHTFLAWLEGLTGYRGILPDPAFSHCGMHSTGRGGKLLIHSDQSRHREPRFDQLLNLIYFANPGWKEEWGGHLELWDFKAKKCVQKIAPINNRLVIFNTGTYTWHGHPHPLQCPEGVRRKSLSVYYYMLDRPFDQHFVKKNTQVHWLAMTPEEAREMQDIKKNVEAAEKAHPAHPRNKKK